MQDTDWPFVEMGAAAHWSEPNLYLKKVWFYNPSVRNSITSQASCSGYACTSSRTFHEGDDVTNDDFTYRRFKLISYFKLCSTGW
jgi:hypothetical protein